MVEAIQDCVALLRVPRSALGICCSSRGAVAGRLMLKERPNAPWLDCTTLGSDGALRPACPTPSSGPPACAMRSAV